MGLAEGQWRWQVEKGRAFQAVGHFQHAQGQEPQVGGLRSRGGVSSPGVLGSQPHLHEEEVHLCTSLSIILNKQDVEIWIYQNNTH